MADVEFWFEFASTYSYPAAMRVAKIAEAHGVHLVWRPFLLGPVFFKQGLKDSPFNVGVIWNGLPQQMVCRSRSHRSFRKMACLPRGSHLWG